VITLFLIEELFVADVKLEDSVLAVDLIIDHNLVSSFRNVPVVSQVDSSQLSCKSRGRATRYQITRILRSKPITYQERWTKELKRSNPGGRAAGISGLCMLIEGCNRCLV
jgi:hypothetical protein